MNLKELPKVELHVHLDGSVRIRTLQEGQDRNIRNDVVAPDQCADLKDYLNRFSLPVAYLQTKEHITRVTKELIEDLERENVIYAEIRFSPIKLMEGNLTIDEVMEAVLEGRKNANMTVQFILCMMRGDSLEHNYAVIDCTKKYLDKGVCAIDLAGDEAGYPTRDYRELFTYAKANHVPFTIHAGEVDIEDSIESALSFGAKRLGHGIQVCHYPKLLDFVKQNQVLLEICPTSNVQTHVVKRYEDHPIKRLMQSGCKISISTDNRTVSNITLTEEYQKLVNVFQMTEVDLLSFQKNAIEAAFLNSLQKETLYQKIARYEDYIKE